MSTVVISGGGFSDSEGNPLASGTVCFSLSADATDNATGTQQICAGQIINYTLDTNGNVPGSAALWPNDLITSNVSGVSDTYYWMSAEDENGQLVYGPNAFQILSTPSPFVLNALVPGNPS